MGRLEDIAERNKHPRRHSEGKFPFGILMSAVVLLILVLMIFTSPGGGPKKPVPATEPPATQGPPPAEEKGRVRDIGIVVEHRKVARDAGVSD